LHDGNGLHGEIQVVHPAGNKAAGGNAEAGRVHLEYYDPRVNRFEDTLSCASSCASCGACRDCSLCETICPQTAISRRQLEGEAYEYVVDAGKCIGCGFCVGTCPCGIWQLVENEPLE
jgi:Fe-S-cluster-containing hydrogenase component 2